MAHSTDPLLAQVIDRIRTEIAKLEKIEAETQEELRKLRALLAEMEHPPE